MHAYVHLCVCVCVHAYVCVLVCERACVFVPWPALISGSWNPCKSKKKSRKREGGKKSDESICIYIYINIHIERICIYIYMNIHIERERQTYIHTYIYVYIYIHTYIYICMYIFVCMYISTDKQTHTRTNN